MPYKDPERGRTYFRQYHQAHREIRSAQQKAYYQTHREGKLTYAREYQQAHAHEHHEASLAYSRRNTEKKRGYYVAHRDEQRASMRAYYMAHREESWAYTKEYQRTHPEVLKATQERRRAAKLRSPGTVTSGQWRAICKAYGSRCAYCEEKTKLTMDHVIPLSKGGSHTPDNIVPACRSCNSAKSAGPPKPLPAIRLLL